METTSDLWVYIETDAQGRALAVGLELLGVGKTLAARQGGLLTAVVIGGQGVEQAARESQRCGAQKVLLADGPDEYETGAYTSILCALLKRYRPLSLLIGATDNGRDLAPRVACRLRTGLTADCTGLAFDTESRAIVWTRPTLGGSLMARIVCPRRLPQMGTVRPGVFQKPAPVERKAEWVRVSLPVLEEPRARLLSATRKPPSDRGKLESAEIIVAGGRGAGGPEGFALLRRLAERLGGSLAASRGAVESGWMPQVCQVGQTGCVVRPRLYIACGISGSVQHMAGMERAETIVAINKDACAPICKQADYTLIGDLLEIVPAWLALLET